MPETVYGVDGSGCLHVRYGVQALRGKSMLRVLRLTYSIYSGPKLAGGRHYVRSCVQP